MEAPSDEGNISVNTFRVRDVARGIRMKCVYLKVEIGNPCSGFVLGGSEEVFVISREGSSGQLLVATCFKSGGMVCQSLVIERELLFVVRCFNGTV